MQQQQQQEQPSAGVTPAPVAASAPATTTLESGQPQSGGASVLGQLSSSAQNSGRMVAGQVTGQVDSVLKRLHFSEYKSAVLAEMFGSFLLTLTVSLAQTGEASEKKMMPLAVGFMYASLIFTFGYISGGHFNPAMTLGIWLSRDGPKSLVWHKAVLYWMFQLVGSGLAAFYCLLTHGGDFAVPTTPNTFYPGIFRVLITEAVFTFVLVSVMLHVATSKQKDNSFYGFAVGMAMMSATLANNGGVLNPAIATSLIAIKCLTTGQCVPVLHLWVFWAGELFGCIMAAIFYNVASATLDAQEKERQQQESAVAEQEAVNQQQASLQFGDAPQDVTGVVLREQEGGNGGGVPSPGRGGVPSAAAGGGSSANPYQQQQQQQQQQSGGGGVTPVAHQQQQFATPDVEMRSKAPTAAPSPSGSGDVARPAPIHTSGVEQQQQQQSPAAGGQSPAASGSLGEDVSPLYS